MSEKILRDFRQKLAKSVLDILLMKYAKEKGKVDGYGFMKYAYENLNIIFSSGSVYAQLYKLEREGLMKSERTPKQIFKLTSKGTNVIGVLLNSHEIQTILEIFSFGLKRSDTK